MAAQCGGCGGFHWKDTKPCERVGYAAPWLCRECRKPLDPVLGKLGMHMWCAADSESIATKNRKAD